MKLFKKTVVFLLALAIAVFCAVPALAAGAAAVNIPVKSSLSGTAAGETLSYILKADAPAYPMPNGSVNNEKAVTVTGNGEALFGEIIYSRVGVYTYTVYQIAGNNPNCTYDSVVYALTVSVINGKDGGLTAIPFLTRPDSEYKWERADFVNQYYSDEGALTVIKSANRGTAKPGEEIIYTLTATNNGNTPLYGIRIRDYIPEYTLFRSINDKYGKFGSINDRDHVTWFIPTLETGQSVTLSFTVLVDDCLPKNATVKNTALYEVTGDPTPVPPNDPTDPSAQTNRIDTPQPGNTPQTGDTSNIWLYIALIIVSAALLAGCFYGKRRLVETQKKGEIQ